MGTLERREERYALVNDEGVLEAYVIPRKSLELDRYVGQFVELTVREPILPSNGEPKLWVDRISLPARTARGQVRPASHLSDVAEALAPAQFSEPTWTRSCYSAGDTGGEHSRRKPVDQAAGSGGVPSTCIGGRTACISRRW